MSISNCHNLFRFVNAVINSSLDKKMVWSYVISIRFEYLEENIDPECNFGFFPPQNISNNVNKLSQMIGDQNSEEINRNFSQRDINETTEMFLALISCPLSFFEEIYLKAIYGPDSRMVMLASNIIKKTKGNYKKDAIQIFARLSAALGFSYHLNENENDGKNIELSQNILDVKGEIPKYFPIFQTYFRR